MVDLSIPPLRPAQGHCHQSWSPVYLSGLEGILSTPRKPLSVYVLVTNFRPMARLKNTWMIQPLSTGLARAIGCKPMYIFSRQYGDTSVKQMLNAPTLNLSVYVGIPGLIYMSSYIFIHKNTIKSVEKVLFSAVQQFTVVFQ